MGQLLIQATRSRLALLALAIESFAIAIAVQLSIQPHAHAQTDNHIPSDRCDFVIPQTQWPLSRTLIRSNGDQRCLAQAFCSTISRATLPQYEQLIERIRLEVAATSTEERSRRPEDAFDLTQFKDVEDLHNLMKCLIGRANDAKPSAQFAVYLILSASHRPIPENRHHWLRKAADSGHPLAQYEFAEYIRSNLGKQAPYRLPIELRGQVSSDRYMDWLERAVAGQVPEAQYMLARICLGLEHQRFRWKRVRTCPVVELLRQAAKTPPNLSFDYRPIASAELGHLYFEGRYVPRDYMQAHYWYSLVPLNECVVFGSSLFTAINRLVRMYEEGLGVGADPWKAGTIQKSIAFC